MIRLKVIKYCLNISKPGDATQYGSIQRTCEELGYRKFEVFAPSYLASETPDAGEIEEQHLFESQYNLSGYRVHDWFECYEAHANNKRRDGYYLVGETDADIPALRKLQSQSHRCGYCGYTYVGDNPPTFCDDCLSNAYLEDHELRLLRLVSLLEMRETSLLIPRSIRELRWSSLRPELSPAELDELRPRYQHQQQLRLEKVRQQKIAENHAKQEAARRDWLVEDWLLRNGINTDNVIYYTHTDEWCWGWRKVLTIPEKEALRTHLQAIFSAELFERMVFKTSPD